METDDGDLPEDPIGELDFDSIPTTQDYINASLAYYKENQNWTYNTCSNCPAFDFRYCHLLNIRVKTGRHVPESMCTIYDWDKFAMEHV